MFTTHFFQMRLTFLILCFSSLLAKEYSIQIPSQLNNLSFTMNTSTNEDLKLIYTLGKVLDANYFFINSSSIWMPEKTPFLQFITAWSDGTLVSFDYLKAVSTSIPALPGQVVRPYTSLYMTKNGDILTDNLPTASTYRFSGIEKRWAPILQGRRLIPCGSYLNQIITTTIQDYGSTYTGLLATSTDGTMLFLEDKYPYATHILARNLGKIKIIRNIRIGNNPNILILATENGIIHISKGFADNHVLIRESKVQLESLNQILTYKDLARNMNMLFLCTSEGVFSFNLALLLEEEEQTYTDKWQTLETMPCIDLVLGIYNPSETNTTELLIAGYAVSKMQNPVAVIWNLQDLKMKQYLIRQSATWASARVLSLAFNYRTKNVPNNHVSILEGVPVLVISLDEYNIDEYELTSYPPTLTRLCNGVPFSTKMFFTPTNITNLSDRLRNPNFNNINLGLNMIDSSLRIYEKRFYLLESTAGTVINQKIVFCYNNTDFKFKGQFAQKQGYGWIAAAYSVAEFFYRDSWIIDEEGQQCEWPALIYGINCCKFTFEPFVPYECRRSAMLQLLRVKYVEGRTLDHMISLLHIQHEIINNHPILILYKNEDETIENWQIIIGFETDDDTRATATDKLIIFVPEATSIFATGYKKIPYDDLRLPIEDGGILLFWKKTVLTLPLF